MVVIWRHSYQSVLYTMVQIFIQCHLEHSLSSSCEIITISSQNIITVNSGCKTEDYKNCQWRNYNNFHITPFSAVGRLTRTLLSEVIMPERAIDWYLTRASIYEHHSNSAPPFLFRSRLSEGEEFFNFNKGQFKTGCNGATETCLPNMLIDVQSLY